MSKLLFSVLSSIVLFVTSAQANVEVNFYESAPKDSFVIKNTGNCSLDNIRLKIDLSKSVGKLIFDTTSTGAGVEVFQPFEITKGKFTLASSHGVKDGDTVVVLNIPSLISGDSVSFTIDVDDTLPVSELGKIRVTGSEINNALVQLSLPKQQTVSATFNRNSKAMVTYNACSA